MSGGLAFQVGFDRFGSRLPARNCEINTFSSERIDESPRVTNQKSSCGRDFVLSCAESGVLADHILG